MRLALTARGREGVRPVKVLLERLLAPLGGRDEPRAVWCSSAT
jgi:hypothetical protein